MIAICIAGYLFSPIQLVPNFIPVFGFIDDVVVLYLGVTLLRRITPPDVLAECRELANVASLQKRKQIGSARGAMRQ